MLTRHVALRMTQAVRVAQALAITACLTGCANFPPYDDHPASKDFRHWSAVTVLAPRPNEAQLAQRQAVAKSITQHDASLDHLRVYLMQAGQTDRTYWFDLAIASRDRDDVERGDSTQIASCIVHDPHRYLRMNDSSTAEFLRVEWPKFDPKVRAIEPYFKPDVFTIGNEYVAVFRLAVVKAETAPPLATGSPAPSVLSLDENAIASLIKRSDKRTVVVGTAVEIAPRP